MSISRQFLDIFGTVDKPGEQTFFSFEGIAGERIFFDGLTADPNIRYQLVSPSGTVVVNLTNAKS